MKTQESPTNPHAAGKAAQVPKLNFHVSGHIKQLCDTANNYSVELGLGPKVRAQDFIDASSVAIARDHAALVSALQTAKACLKANRGPSMAELLQINAALQSATLEATP